MAEWTAVGFVMAPRSPQDSFSARYFGAPRRPRRLQQRLGLLLTAALVLLTGGLAPGFPAQSSLQVAYSAGKLSVVAEHVPLTQVLGEISRRTGLDVRGAQALAQPVSVHFSDVPVAQGLQDLLRGTNYALFGNVSSAEGTRQARVVILSATPGAPIDVAGQVQAARSAMTQVERDAIRAALMNQNPAMQDAGFRGLAKLSPAEAIQFLEDVIANGDGQARLRALQFLDQDSRLDQGATLGALRNALSDQDTSLRDYGIQALGRRSGSDSLDLLNQMFANGDANVRLSVIESVAQRPDARPLLQQAASDPDQAVSALAAQLLQSIGDRQPNP